MYQSDRTLHYHLHSIRTLLDLVRSQRVRCRAADLVRMDASLNGAPDPNAQAERVELRCPICGRQNCPLDVRRRI